MRWNYLSISKFQRQYCWSMRIDRLNFIHTVNKTYLENIWYAQCSHTILHSDGNEIMWWPYKRQRPSGHNFSYLFPIICCTVKMERYIQLSNHLYKATDGVWWNNAWYLSDSYYENPEKNKGSFLFAQVMYRILKCICDWKIPAYGIYIIFNLY